MHLCLTSKLTKKARKPYTYIPMLILKIYACMIEKIMTTFCVNILINFSHRFMFLYSFL